MAPKNLKYASLCDIYGGLLSEKQRNAVEMYYCDDLSLAEIAEHMGITRQGVRDQIKHAEDELTRFEEKLSLFERRICLSQISGIFDVLLSEISNKNVNVDEIIALCKSGKKLSESLLDEGYDTND